MQKFKNCRHETYCSKMLIFSSKCSKIHLRASEDRKNFLDSLPLAIKGGKRGKGKGRGGEGRRWRGGEGGIWEGPSQLSQQIDATALSARISSTVTWHELTSSIPLVFETMDPH
jgi:hypothetical protein